MEEKKERRNRTTKSVGNGEGSLYWSEALKKYVYQYYVKGDPTRKTMTQRKNEEVKDFRKRVRDLQTKIDNGTYIKKNNDTLISILERYVEQKNKDGVTSDRTYIRDKETLNQLKKICSSWITKPIQKIKVEDIEDSKLGMRDYSNSTIQKMWIMLKKGFKIALSRRKINYNPMDDDTLIKPISKKAQKRKKALSKEEENKLKDVLSLSSHKYNSIILLQLNTGMRIGEVLALSKDCIDLKNNTITVYRTITRNKNDKVILGEHTKTFDKKTGIDKGKRTFPMNNNVRKLIIDLLSSKIANINNLLFWDYKKDCFITDGEINSYLLRLNKKYKILDSEDETLSTHRLRHTFITRCQEQGLSLPVIQTLVGHVEGSSITNDVYTDVSLDFITNELKKMC